MSGSGASGAEGSIAGEDLARAGLGAGIIGPDEHAALVRAVRLRDEVIRVDDFPPDLALAAEARPAVQRAVATPAPSALMPSMASEAGDLDLHALGQALMRKRGWIILPTLLALVLSLVAVNMVTPRFKSEVRILIDGRESVFLRPNGERNEERNPFDAEAVTSQVQLLQSRDLAREIIKKNKLAERPEFDPVLQGFSPLKSLLALFGIGRDPFSLLDEVADLRASTITCHVNVDAPKEGRATTRVNWLVRQLKNAPDSTRVEAFANHSRGSSAAELLATARENPASLALDATKQLRAFRVAATKPLGKKRGRGRGSFIDSVLDAVDDAARREVVLVDVPRVERVRKVLVQDQVAEPGPGGDQLATASDVADAHRASRPVLRRQPRSASVSFTRLPVRSSAFS